MRKLIASAIARHMHKHDPKKVKGVVLAGMVFTVYLCPPEVAASVGLVVNVVWLLESP